MKYQVYIRGITADIKAPPPPVTDDPVLIEQAIDAVIEKAVRAVGTFPVEHAGEPMYVGANTWLVPFTDAPIGSPIEANSAEQAIAKAEEIIGYMGEDLRAEEVGEA